MLVYVTFFFHFPKIFTIELINLSTLQLILYMLFIIYSIFIHLLFILFSGNPLCPVLSLKKYLSKRHPGNNFLWQRALESFIDTNDIWYYKSPMGKNTLGTMMVTISKAANLSKRYTNHCIRATCVSALDCAGFEARQIMSVSGHKAETSIRSYSNQISEQTKRNMSGALLSKAGILPRAPGNIAIPSTSYAPQPEAVSTNVSILPALPVDTSPYSAQPALLPPVSHGDNNNDISLSQLLQDAAEWIDDGISDEDLLAYLPNKDQASSLCPTTNATMPTSVDQPNPQVSVQNAMQMQMLRTSQSMPFNITQCTVNFNIYN